MSQVHLRTEPLKTAKVDESIKRTPNINISHCLKHPVKKIMVSTHGSLL